MDKSAVLLICFDFPPNSGIGGRRWAKFSKSLAQEGYSVYVIKANPTPQNTPSAWSDDVQQPSIEVHSLPRVYPHIVSHGPVSYFDKLTYRLELLKLRRRVKGTIYDAAIGWEKHLIPKASELIEKHDIRNMIITGAPFNLFVYGASLKRKYPHLNYIADYRDPWLTAPNYGMQNLSDKRKLVEVEKQNQLFAAVDTITAPATEMLRQLKSECSEASQPAFYHLAHSYDEEEVAEIKSSRHRTAPNDEVRLIYGGALYIGLEPHLERLNNALTKIRKDNPLLYRQLTIDLYTPHHRFKNIFEENSDKVHFHEPIGTDFFRELLASHASFIFLSEHNKNFQTTKFYEVLAYKKPFVYVGAEGDTASLIREQSLGCVLHDTEDLAVICTAVASHQHITAASYFIERHSLKNRTRELMALLK